MKKIYNTFTIAFEKCKTISLVSLIMKNICIFSSGSRFSVKSSRCIASGSASSACYLLKSIAISLQYALK